MATESASVGNIHPKHISVLHFGRELKILLLFELHLMRQ